ncbi:MAG: tetratricopeptide repeat protein [Pseudomonadota bacterium]
MRGLIILTTSIAGLTACMPSPERERLDQRFVGPDAPDGTVVLEQAIDGLIVGDRLMEAGQFELALRAYTRAAAEDGITVDTLTAIGSANLRLGRLGQAEDLFRRALEIEDDFIPALNNLAVVLIERGEFGEARRLLEQAFALDSGRSDSIRDNLRLAIARMENTVYSGENNDEGLRLIRRGGGVYTLR